MKRNLLFKALLALAAVSLVLTACGGATTPTTAPTVPPVATDVPATTAPVDTAVPAASETPAAAGLSGEITVLTNRTDVVDTLYVDYAKKFNEKYPDVKVNFEALRDYAGEVQIRMNGTDYGDVLLIPDTITLDKLGNYFEPLGTVADLDSKYIFVTEKAFDGTVYGIPTIGVAQGVACNKTVLDAAGVTTPLKTPDEFLAAMKLVKEKTGAIPVYTNYAAGWPLQSLGNLQNSISGDPDYGNKLAHMDAPFAPGTPHYILYKLVYDLVKEGLTEEDPTTSDWETSKQLIGEGKVACMFLGSWSINQFQAFAKSPSDITYLPFPSNIDGKQFASAAGDWKIGVSKNSKNKEAALAWLWWFINESGDAVVGNNIPPLKSAELPAALADFQKQVTFVQGKPAPAGEEALFSNIDKESEIGLSTDPKWVQRIIDRARGAEPGTLDELFKEFNDKWAAARAKLGVKP